MSQQYPYLMQQLEYLHNDLLNVENHSLELQQLRFDFSMLNALAEALHQQNQAFYPFQFEAFLENFKARGKKSQSI
jgi:prefoldin subunit 5